MEVLSTSQGTKPDILPDFLKSPTHVDDRNFFSDRESYSLNNSKEKMRKGGNLGDLYYEFLIQMMVSGLFQL